MDYSVEEIFFLSGQYDKVVNVSFKYKSESYNLYGKHITGEFIYSPSERKELQDTISKNDFARNDGYVKFKGLLSELSDEKKKILSQKGFKVSDIVNVLQMNGNLVNQYSDTKTRSLPKPIELKVDFSKVDNDLLTIRTYSQMAESGYKLIQEESDQLYAAILNKYGNQISREKFNELFVDNETRKIKKGIRYHQLENKYFSKPGLNSEEDEEFKTLLKERSKDRVPIIIKELEKSTEKLKEIGIQYPQALNIATALASRFEEERLLMCHFPVWWDFERFLHIYLRHVQETQVGERFAKKTQFQYSFKDIRKLIEIVLEKIQDEIEEHFIKSPTKDFKRQGSRSVYYNGDFYTVHIATNGRLMTFYKYNPNQDGV